jgi:hypothetical protein
MSNNVIIFAIQDCLSHNLVQSTFLHVRWKCDAPQRSVDFHFGDKDVRLIMAGGDYKTCAFTLSYEQALEFAQVLQAWE